jgi:hypothetical protein
MGLAASRALVRGTLANMQPPTFADSARRLAFGLALTPSIVCVAAISLPNLHVASGLANTVSFAGATLVPILALALAATAQVTLAANLGVAAVAVVALIVLAILHSSSIAAMVTVDGALVSGAWAIGAAIGRRVQHVSHLLPACVVAASADIVSSLSPEGPTHAIASSDRALSIVAVWFPVPGTHAVAPALGVGDLLFMALVFGVAVVHRLPYARTVFLAALGTSIAGFAAAWFAVPVPALVPIAAVLLLGLPTLRRLRPADRTAAKWSIIVASSVVLAVIARNFLSR